jgi:virginiamycin B lyase
MPITVSILDLADSGQIYGGSMRSQLKFAALAGLAFFLAASCFGATLSGTVKGPDGAPLEGAFVQVQNTKTKISFFVLSNHEGQYRVEKLPEGEYRVQVKATGLRGDPKSGVALAADQSVAVDFELATGMVRWNELSIEQAKKLWPEDKAKQIIFTKCFICHGFQTRMASVRRDLDGWKDRVQFMREAMHFSLSYRITDQDAADVAAYLNKLYGEDSVFPKSPVDVPGYKETVRPFTSEAMKIAYVEYDMPGPSRMPFSAAPAKDGSIWIPNFGIGNKITRLNPKTAEMQDFSVPNEGTAAVHSAIAAPDGSVWLTEQASDKLGRWDPTTQKITEYQDTYLPGMEGREDGGSRHTVRIDSKGMVWSSGYPLTRFDPETGKYYDFPEAAHTYSLAFDKDENVWFTNPGTGQIGKVDAKTLKVKQWMPPTLNTYERRIAIDTDGTVWFGEFQKGKIGRFDPKTEAFKEYDVPGGVDAFPYAIGIGADHSIWYSSYYLDVIGRLDPKTGKIIEYPFPHSENTIREFFPDSDGRMWYGSPSNNKVGYFYLTGTSVGAGK